MCIMRQLCCPQNPMENFNISIYTSPTLRIHLLSHWISSVIEFSIINTCRVIFNLCRQLETEIKTDYGKFSIHPRLSFHCSGKRDIKYFLYFWLTVPIGIIPRGNSKKTPQWINPNLARNFSTKNKLYFFSWHFRSLPEHTHFFKDKNL